MHTKFRKRVNENSNLTVVEINITNPLSTK